jgi:uncharacterized protein YeeX (DUF496 family)
MPKGVRLGGRQKGTPNKATADVREAIAALARNMAGEVEGWLREIEDPAKRVDLYAKLIEYHIPKLSRAEVTGDGGKAIEISIVRYTPPA